MLMPRKIPIDDANDEAAKKQAEQRQKSLAATKRFQAKNRERHLAQRKAFRERHRERLQEEAKEAYRNNRPYFKAWYEKQKTEDPDYLKKQYALYRDRLIATAKRWRKDNPEANKEITRRANHVRRLRKQQCTEHYTLAEIRELRKKCGSVCAYCKTTAKMTIDHIIPLSKGGSNGIRNIHFVCFPCNARKQDSDPIDYAQKFGLLL